MSVVKIPAIHHYRAIWISDVHLGSRGCHAESLLDFLHSVECDFLYLVGDIVDIVSLKKRRYWPQSHNNVLRTILGKAKHNTRVIYVPGNHDALMRSYKILEFGNVILKPQTVHIAADGKKYLVMHGDQFDHAVRFPKLVSYLGGVLYDWVVDFGALVNWFRSKFQARHWSLVRYMKNSLSNASVYVQRYEEAAVRYAGKRIVDGIICGHIHVACLSQRGNVLYGNCGDWVENCTALVETVDGQLHLLDCSDKIKRELGEKIEFRQVS